MTRAPRMLHPLAGLGAAPPWARAIQLALAVAVAASVPAAYVAARTPGVWAPRQVMAWPVMRGECRK